MIRALSLAVVLAGLAGGVAAQTVTVPIDRSVRLSVGGSAASVVVGNPQVADVTVVDSHTVFVSGRGFGETDVYVLDAAGRTLYSGEIMVGSPTGGRVSVYRGGQRTDMACAPGCEVSFRSSTKGTSSGAAGGAAGAPQGGGQPGGIMGGVGNVVGGAMSAATGAIGHAVAPTAQ